MSEYRTIGKSKKRVDALGRVTGDTKYVADIFDPYFTTKSSGTGLGLAIVHNTLAAHGGRIEVETKQAQGTTVSLFLPLIKKRAADELSGKKSPNHDSSSFKS